MANKSSVNQLLARLPADYYRRLAPFMQSIVLSPRQVIYKVRGPIDYVYFPTSGIISAMSMMNDGRAIEVATIGKEGVAGLSAFIGNETSPYEVMVQVEGAGLRLKADIFRESAAQDGPLRRLLARYHTAFSMQTAYSVACNGLHTVEKHCCRWLLMTQDRVDSDVLPLTHEFLAIMLGVRRSSVTDVLRPIQEQGVVHNGRGEIKILDRSRLESLACECYEAVNEEFARLFG